MGSTKQVGPRLAKDRPRGTERTSSRRVGHATSVALLAESLSRSLQPKGEPMMGQHTEVTLDRVQRAAIREELELRSSDLDAYGALCALGVREAA
jgi:hypothetical protein